MSILYRFTVDDTITSEEGNIRGWDKVFTSLKRDSSELKGLLLTQDAQFEFIGDLYIYVYNKLFTAGVCNEIDFLVEESHDNGTNYLEIIRSKIFSRDIELDIIKGVAKIKKLTDDSFFARIDNNKNIGTVPDAGRSKNDVSITKAPQYAVTLYDPVDGTQAGTTTPMFFVNDVMKYLVSFMSDGEVKFRSDLLNNDLKLMITNGFAIRTETLSSPNFSVSFFRLLKNLRGSRDIGFGIEYDTNKKPILRVEKASYFSQNNVADTFNDPLTIKASIDSSSLYSRVKFGSNPTISQNEDPDVSFLEEIKYNGFKEEEFHILGQCNIDSTLDLVKDIGVSSNLIQHIIYQRFIFTPIDPDTSNDDTLIFVHCSSVNTGLLTANAVMTDVDFSTGTTPTYYNQRLTNSQTGKDYYTSFQGSLASFLNFTVNDFEGTITTSFQTTIANTLNPFPSFWFGVYDVIPIIYNTEVDPGNNFNPATGYYTCPVTGFYTFSFFLKADLLTTSVLGDYLIRIVDDAGAILGETLLTDDLQSTTTYQGVVSISIYRTAGDLVGTSVHMAYASTVFNPTSVFRILTGTRFSASATPDSGGIFQEYNQGDVQKLFFETQYPLSPSRFNAIANLQRSSTNINSHKKYSIYWAEKNRHYEGHIHDIKYDHKNQKANIILKASINSSETFRIKVPAYKFEFDMLNDFDKIQSFDYDIGGGGTNVICSITLNQDTDLIEAALLSLFTGESISFDEIVIERIYIGGNKYSYTIIFVNPKLSGASTTIDLIDVEGAVKASQTIFY